RAGLSPWSELEVLAEVLLIDDPGHQRPPLSAPVLVLRIVPILHGHSFRCHVAIEAKPNVGEYFTHDSPLACSDVGLMNQANRRRADGASAPPARRAESARGWAWADSRAVKRQKRKNNWALTRMQKI